MSTIKAAVCHTFGEPFSIEDIAIRAPIGEEIEVTLAACAICHSDITYAEGHWGGSLPAVYGHEAAGTVTATGPNARGINVGDKVVVTLIRACGSCPSCSAARPTNCEEPYDGDDGPIKTTDGGKLHQAMACGGFAEKVVVDSSQVVTLPDGISMEAASLLACGVITGIGAVVNAAKVRPGQDVVIIGAGGVGLNAIQGAAIAGARRIVAVDMEPSKLDVAKEFGATDAVLATGEPWKEAKKTMGRGADAVLVTVGVAPVYDQAPRYLAKGGNVVMVGMPPSGAFSEYEAANFAAAGQSMIGSKMGDVVIKRDIPWMVDLYKQGRLKLDELISGTWSLDQINEAIEDTKTGAAKRNVIVF
ncbi:Zn-dependent alcohol dehydrogenase [Octadecabacter sp. 1_MG-2023]|uniref:Zn-dependent alcohol dehydrogenase n=1 Tax=unclassified Octadecabacter TaxID=196158 RepID=UPI001C091532|nr:MULTISPECIES: Zn-dependent alcohol dehydrogenase [unclassified Octadecabacter]MBU2994523.1 Zn-dependent alcohol dehydrogenase [Octadecabacter sp. B2R22]MDO6734184.1 Zn-dependent alcohol dehydrogenase [Octadecabacter sp. 1_MG-2023]